MMHVLYRHCWAVLLAASLAVGCSPESILVVTLEHDTLPADGRSGTTVTVRAFFDGEPVNNERVDLSVSHGQFERGRTEVRLTTTAGEASAQWEAPYERDGRPFEGDVTFSASYEDPYRNQQEARAVLRMVAPSPVDGSSFRFWCAAQNTQRPRSGGDSVRIPCTIEARDMQGNDVEIDDVRFGFMAEAGSFEFDRDGNLEWVLPPGDRPRQTEPLGTGSGGEPYWVDQAAGVTRNPRDGIVTLVVHTHGRPTGQTDPLQGEPFVDVNDDGMWNPGEPYFDANGNEQYDGPTGSTEDRRIWRWTKIMVTGPVNQNAPENSEMLALWDTGEHSRQNIRVARGTEVTLSLLLVDENLNPVASHPGRNPDYVRVNHRIDGGGGAFEPRDQELSADITGVAFDQYTGAVVAGASRDGYLQGRTTYNFRIRNNRSSDDEGDPVPWRVESVEVRRIPYPGTSSQITEWLDGHDLPRGYLD